MRHIDKPSIGKTAAEIFDECSQNFVKKSDYQALGKYYRPLVDKASKEYIAFMPKDVNKLQRPKLSETDADFFKSVYKQKFSAAGSIGRIYYDKLFLNAGRTCPLCDLGVEPSELDHFLPKSQYPLLSVTPENLIPSCIVCNKRKSSNFTNDYYSIPFHPYYEDITEKWLDCKISFYEDSYDVSFYNSTDKSNDLWGKYEAQLKYYRLPFRYSLYAISYINSCSISFKMLLESNGEDFLKKHLADIKNTHESNNINSVHSAIHREFINNFSSYCLWLRTAPIESLKF